MATRLRTTTVNTAHRDDHQRKLSEECLSNPISSSTLEIILDDQSISNSGNEDSSSQDRQSCAGSTSREKFVHRRRKHLTSGVSESQSGREQMDVCSSGPKKDPKSHRLIEKRRRDRMNACLSELLELTPHEIPESQRRIEKTEIIEMAVKYIRSLKSSNQKSFDPIDLNKRSNVKIDTYSSGYHNAAYDIFEYIEKHFNNDRLPSDLNHFIKEKESSLKELTVVPPKKDKIVFTKKPPCEPSKSDEHENLFQFSINDQPNTLPSTKVPIFVLHPSGTHYIPMSIDLSIVSHAFHSKPPSEQALCHPVSIPVNFNPTSTLSDSYELDIQNINVIGTRHQTSVRPN